MEPASRMEWISLVNLMAFYTLVLASSWRSSDFIVDVHLVIRQRKLLATGSMNG